MAASTCNFRPSDGVALIEQKPSTSARKTRTFKQFGLPVTARTLLLRPGADARLG